MRRILVWAVVLTTLLALYTAGLAYGHPLPRYSPSTVEKAWLNAATVYHPDEYFYVGIPYRMLLTRAWNPHFYENPSLTIYTNLSLFWFSGAERMPHDLAYGEREIAPFQLYVMARYLSALYALLAVVLTYAAGRVAFNRRAGSVAALLVALSPLMVQHAHYATPNTQTTMLSTAALLAGLIILKGHYPPHLPLWAIYLIGGLLVGLTMSARYNAAVVGLVTGLAMLTAWWRHRHWLLVAIGLAAMPIGFAIGMPGILFATREVIDQIRYILRFYRERGGGPGFTTDQGLSAYYYHWRYVVLIAAGPVAAGFALLGLVAACWRGRSKAHWQDAWIGLVLALYLLAYTVLALPGRRIQANLLFPLIAPLALLAGYGITWLWDQWDRRPWVIAGLVVILLAWPATVSILFAYRIATPDTRMDAQEWIYAHVPRGSTVHLFGSYNVPLDPLDYRTTQTFDRQEGLERLLKGEEQIVVYSDARPFIILRDPALASDRDRAREAEITRVLSTDWIELARFRRMPWPGEHLPPDDVSYWHQMEIVIYCNPADCPVDIPPSRP
jgi:hypothetical protein